MVPEDSLPGTILVPNNVPLYAKFGKHSRAEEMTPPDPQSSPPPNLKAYEPPSPLMRDSGHRGILLLAPGASLRAKLRPRFNRGSSCLPLSPHRTEALSRTLGLVSHIRSLHKGVLYLTVPQSQPPCTQLISKDRVAGGVRLTLEFLPPLRPDCEEQLRCTPCSGVDGDLSEE